MNELQLKYGCNPNQKPSRIFMANGNSLPIEVLNGKPGYINFMDAFNGWQLVSELKKATGLPSATSFKHVSPAGAAVGLPLTDTLKKIYWVDDLGELSPLACAYARARGADRMSSYGDFIALSDKCDVSTAKIIQREVSDGVIAPDYDADALELLQTKKKNLRILKVTEPPKSKTQFRQIDGGLLVQSTDLIDAPGDDPDAWKLVSGKPADEQTIRDLVFAWRAIRCVKSNAILIAHDQATVGIGMGQVNRVDSANLSVERANTLADGANRTQGAVAASDAFFPFADGAEILINAGVKAIVQPGGSIRDEEVFEAARKAGVTMYVTGTRHFFH